MSKDHAPEITHHITEEHAKGPIFESAVYPREGGAHPKTKGGCYENAGKPSRQEKM